MAQMYTTAGWWAVLLFAMPLYTTRIAYTRFVEVREMFTETVSSLAEAVDKRDKFTSGHSHRVQNIAVDIGKAMKCSDDELEALEWGGLLHDIGKIGVPDAVLLKQERLTRDERAIMNSHPKLGADIIAPVKRLAPEIPIILHHHEWFNGSGYPDRLVADDIPKLARILHVADAFEAMTAARPYRMTPLTQVQALAELRKFGGIQFDPVGRGCLRPDQMGFRPLGPGQARRQRGTDDRPGRGRACGRRSVPPAKWHRWFRTAGALGDVLPSRRSRGIHRRSAVPRGAGAECEGFSERRAGLSADPGRIPRAGPWPPGRRSN